MSTYFLVYFSSRYEAQYCKAVCEALTHNPMQQKK